MEKNIFKKDEKTEKKGRKCGDEGEKADSDSEIIGLLIVFEHLLSQFFHCVTQGLCGAFGFVRSHWVCKKRLGFYEANGLLRSERLRKKRLGFYEATGFVKSDWVFMKRTVY